MSEGLETNYLRMPLVATELPLSQAQENPRRLSKKLIAGISGLLIVSCIIATMYISSPQSSLSQDSIQLSSLQGSSILAADSGDSKLNFSVIAHLEDFDAEYPYHISSDGKYLTYESTSSECTVRSLEDFSVVYSTPCHYQASVLNDLYLSSDGKTLALLVNDYTLNLYDLEKKSTILSYQNEGYLNKVVLTKDNNFAVLISDYMVGLYSIHFQGMWHIFESLKGDRRDLKVVLSDDDQLILVKDDTRTRVFNINTLELLVTHEGSYDFNIFINKNQYLLYASISGRVIVYDILNDRIYFKMIVYIREIHEIAGNDDFIAIAGKNGFEVISLKTGERFECKSPYGYEDGSEDGSEYGSEDGYEDGSEYGSEYRADDGATGCSSAHSIYKLAFTRDGRYLVTGNYDGEVGLFDLKNKIYITSDGLGSGWGVSSLIPKEDGTIVVQVYDYYSKPLFYSYNLNNLALN